MSFNKTIISVFVLVGILAFPLGKVFAAPSPQITGVWVCEGQRKDPQGNLVSFGLNFTFHNDGTMTYSSGSKIDHRGYNDRGGAMGEWEKIGPNLYQWSTVELTYFYPTYSLAPLVTTPTINDPENFRGRLFVVDATSKYDPATGTLCSGRPECPGTSTPVVFCDGLGDTEVCQAPVPANSMCSRLGASLPQ